MGSWPALQESLPLYRLEVALADWTRLHDNLYADSYFVPGRFSYEGRTWSVELRFRGHSSRGFPKKNFQVKFPDADRFFGRRRLELQAEYKDGGALTEKLWYDLAAAAGLVVPSVRYVNLEINGARYGVMTEIERVDKAFLRAHGLDEDSAIYRAGMFDGELRAGPGEPYQDPWEKRTRESEPFDELFAFLQRVNRTPNHELVPMLESELDLEAYLSWLAVDAVIANDLVMDARSFLIRQPGSGRWLYVPWDLNNANSLFSRFEPLDQWNGRSRGLLAFTLYDEAAYEAAELRTAQGLFPDVRPAWSVLSTRLLDVPELRQRFLEKLRALLDDLFTEELLWPRIDAARALLAPELLQDPHVDQAYAAESAQFLKDFVRERRAYLEASLSSLEAHGETPWKIDRVGQDAQGQTFVQLVNTSSGAQSTDGLWLTFRPRYPRGQALPDLSVPAGGAVTFSANAADPRLRLTIHADPTAPEVALFDATGRVALDVLFLDRLRPSEAYGRVPSGSERFERILP